MKDKLTLVSLGVIAATLLGLGVIVRAKGAILLTAPDAELRLASRFGSGVVVPSGVQPVAAAARVYRPALLTLTDRRDGAVW